MTSPAGYTPGLGSHDPCLDCLPVMGGKPEGEEIKSLHDKTNGCAGHLKIYAEITQKLRGLCTNKENNYAEITQFMHK